MLRPDTQALWNFLKGQRALAGFVLVGGSALSMHLDHRVSEDLDFMFPDHRLPRRPIEALQRVAAAAGLPFAADDRPELILDFEDSGLDYLDYHQGFIVGGVVKLTFTAPESEVGRLLRAGSSDGPRVADLEEIFRLKCIACANRSKSRDWLDMYVMLRRGLFQPIDIYRTFELAQVPGKFDNALARMTGGRLGASDEGFAALLPDPPSIPEMQHYFREVFDRIEREVTRSMAERRRLSRPKP